MSRLIIIFVIFIFSLYSCKHTEKIVEHRVRAMSSKRVIKLVKENEIKYKTLSVKRFNLTLKNDGKVNSIRGFYKICEDSIIQISAQKLSIPVGKMEIDKDSFKIAYHIGKTFLTGSYDYISQTVGNDIDYQTIQAILSNHLQLIKSDQRENNSRDFVCNVEEGMYKISSIRDRKLRKFTKNEDRLERYKQKLDDNHLIKQDVFIDADIFVVKKIIYNDIDAKREINIEFSDFNMVEGRWFPGNIHVFFTGDKKIDIQIELAKVSINDEQDFSFNFPAKYSKQVLH